MMWRGIPSDQALQVRFWGVRGSTCASGPNFVGFGGHTPCVEVRCGQRLFVVDAGTGISALGQSLGMSAPDEVDILFSHFHLDHIGGLPFFKPAVLRSDRVVHTYCGHLDGETGEDTLNRLFAPPIFPIRLDQLPARFEHHGFKAGDTLSFRDGLEVRTIPLNHPGGATGYRFDHAGRAVCYISDLEHTTPWPDPDLTRFVRGSDLVIYDGMFSEEEYPVCKGWGHSTWEKGVDLCRAADVEGLAIFHLYPSHTDAMLEAAEAEMKHAMPGAFIARERLGVSFEPRTAGMVAPDIEAAKIPAE